MTHALTARRGGELQKQRRVAVCLAGAVSSFRLAKAALETHVLRVNSPDATVDVFAAVLWAGAAHLQRAALAEFGTLPNVVRWLGLGLGLGLGFGKPPQAAARLALEVPVTPARRGERALRPSLVMPYHVLRVAGSRLLGSMCFSERVVTHEPAVGKLFVLPVPVSERLHRPVYTASIAGFTARQSSCTAVPGRSSQQNRPFEKKAKGAGKLWPKCGSILSRL
jgi:hypothetical protein